MKRRRVREPDLSRLTDGRVWRLTRGRHFNSTVSGFRRELEDMARETGKVVRFAPDKLRPDRHVWVQFGDAGIELGEPCVCGSLRIVRLHRWWARCEACGRRLHVSEPKRDNEAPRTDGLRDESTPDEVASDGAVEGAPLGDELRNGSRPEPLDATEADVDAAEPSTPSPTPKEKKQQEKEQRQREKAQVRAQAEARGKGLDRFDEVALYRHSIANNVEQCFGIGRGDGEPAMLLAVRFPLEDGRRLPNPDVPDQWMYTLGKALVEQFGSLLDPTDVEEGVRVSWKISEDPGPQPHEEMD